MNDYVSQLTPSERHYAERYADHLSIGDPEPARPADVDPMVAADIRQALHQEWQARIHRSPALSGRQRIVRRTIERGRRSG